MAASRYGVRVSRGPRLRPEPHPESCDLKDIREYAAKCDRPLAVDLFCCGGGLSLGLEEAGFEIILGVDLDEYAIETHCAHFGGVSLRADLSNSAHIDRILDELTGIPVSLVAGSPPCQPFSRAGSSKIRSLIQDGVRSDEDERRHLWKGFLTVVEELQPPAVLMENVPDLVSGENSIIFREIVDALESEAYDVHTRILPSWQYGVPQHRQRLFIVGVKSGTPFDWPKATRRDKPGVEEAISDLPEIRAGEPNDGLPYIRNGRPLTALQRWARRGLPRGRGGQVYDHFARPVRQDDLEAFSLMRPTTRYSDLPTHLRRYRTDHFDDKYKRLDPKEPSRTITAHIAHDGYWYIHPTEDRTLTMREAARIQSFPDRFRFSGTPSHVFRQIGEAVPPLVARAIGRALIESLTRGRGNSPALSTKEISKSLMQWIDHRPESKLRAPWRMSKEPWLVLMGMALSQRGSAQDAATSWYRHKSRWPDYETYLSDSKGKSELAHEDVKSRELLDRIADALTETQLDKSSTNHNGSAPSSERWKMAWTLAGKSHNLRLTGPARRLIGRVFQAPPSKTHYRTHVAIARLVGANHANGAYAAVLEIGEQYCKPRDPLCEACPINEFCASFGKASSGHQHLN